MTIIKPKHRDHQVPLAIIPLTRPDHVHQVKDLIEHGAVQDHLRQADHRMNLITLSLGLMPIPELNLPDMLGPDHSGGHRLDVNLLQALSSRD